MARVPDIDHQGYVAGRYRDGLLSDGWTDVERCARGTFVAYVPRCSCGLVGTDRPATQFGAAAARRAWFLGHAQAAPTGPMAPRLAELG